MSEFYTLQYSTPQQGPFGIHGCIAHSLGEFIELFTMKAKSDYDTLNKELKSDSPNITFSDPAAFYDEYIAFGGKYDSAEQFKAFIFSKIDAGDNCPHRILSWPLI